MTAPTVDHELRRVLLGEVADLAGYLMDVVYADDLIPDVVRLHARRPALLVGDAKATETAGCTDTRTRLARYVRHAGRWNAAGFDVTVAICHPLGTGRWDLLINRAAACSGRVVTRPQSTVIDEFSVVTWAHVEYRERTSTT